MFYQVTLNTKAGFTVEASSPQEAARQFQFGVDTVTEIQLPLSGWVLAQQMKVAHSIVERYTNPASPEVCKTCVNGTFFEYQLASDFL